jgi:hypothetical protein
MADMLDVVHYLLEEDSVPASGDQAEARSQFRTRVYADFYDREYKFPINKQQSTSDSIGGTGTSVIPSDGRPMGTNQGMVHKPYIPPTDESISDNPSRPFQGLDAPLG